MDSTIPALLLLVVLVIAWQLSMKIHDRAVHTARSACQSRGVQFLDGTAALRSTRLSFSLDSGPGVHRTYTFDYSENGFERHTGCVIMRNRQVESVLMDG